VPILRELTRTFYSSLQGGIVGSCYSTASPSFFGEIFPYASPARLGNCFELSSEIFSVISLFSPELAALRSIVSLGFRYFFGGEEVFLIFVSLRLVL